METWNWHGNFKYVNLGFNPMNVVEDYIGPVWLYEMKNSKFISNWFLINYKPKIDLVNRLCGTQHTSTQHTLK